MRYRITLNPAPASGQISVLDREHEITAVCGSLEILGNCVVLYEDGQFVIKTNGPVVLDSSEAR